MNTFICHVGRNAQQTTNKQQTNKHTDGHNQSISNLTCSTDTGIMFTNLTIPDANAVSSIST